MHTKIFHGSLINHTCMHGKRTDATIYEEKKDKNNSRSTKLIPSQEKLFCTQTTLHTKIIHGSLINHTCIHGKRTDGTIYEEKKTKIIQGIRI